MEKNKGAAGRLITDGLSVPRSTSTKRSSKGSGHMSRSTQQAGTRAAQRARQVREARGAGAMEIELAEVAYGDKEEMERDPSTWAERGT